MLVDTAAAYLYFVTLGRTTPSVSEYNMPRSARASNLMMKKLEELIEYDAN